MWLIDRIGIGIKRFFGVFGGSVRRVYEDYNYWQSNSIYLDNIYNKIATDVAMLKFKHVKITEDSDGLQKMDYYKHSDLMEVLTVNPNDYVTPVVFIADIVRTMLKNGIAVVLPKYEKGALKSLWLADSFDLIEDHKIHLTVKNQSYTVDINSVWIFENPKQNISAQLGQITKLIDDNLRAVSYKISRQGNSLKGLLKMPFNSEDEEMKKKAEERVSNILDAAKNSGIGYLDKKEEFLELNNNYNTASPEELEFLKNQLYQAFGINEKLFNCDYTEEQYRAYFSSVLKVYQRVIEQEINRKYFSKTARTQGQTLIVYFDMFDIASLKDLNKFVFDMKYSGILNANEGRSILGYSGYQGGDVYETNKNAVQITRGD